MSDLPIARTSGRDDDPGPSYSLIALTGRLSPPQSERKRYRGALRILVVHRRVIRISTASGQKARSATPNHTNSGLRGAIQNRLGSPNSRPMRITCHHGPCASRAPLPASQFREPVLPAIVPLARHSAKGFEPRNAPACVPAHRECSRSRI